MFLWLTVWLSRQRSQGETKRRSEGGVGWCPYLTAQHLAWKHLPQILISTPFPSPHSRPSLICFIISDSEACSTLISLIAWDKAANVYPRHFLFQSQCWYVRALELKLIWQHLKTNLKWTGWRFDLLLLESRFTVTNTLTWPLNTHLYICLLLFFSSPSVSHVILLSLFGFPWKRVKYVSSQIVHLPPCTM